MEPTEPNYALEIHGETEAQKKIETLRKSCEKGVISNSFTRDGADAKVGSYFLLCLGTEGHRQVQQKRPGLDIQATTTKYLMRVLEDVFLTKKIITFKKSNFICSKQTKKESLEHFHASLVELAL